MKWGKKKNYWTEGIDIVKEKSKFFYLLFSVEILINQKNSSFFDFIYVFLGESYEKSNIGIYRIVYYSFAVQLYNYRYGV